jgi:hypothetical protein
MHPRFLGTLCLLLLTSASTAVAAEPAKKGAAAAKPPAAASGEPEDFTPESDPPPGSQADLALWRDARLLASDVSSSRREAIRMNTRIRTERLKERLGEAAQARSAEEAAPLLALQDRLMKDWKESYAILSRRWPVDPIRACDYPWLNFDSALRAAADGSTRADVVSARKDLQTCVSGGRAAVGAMRKSNVTLGATIADVVKALAAAEPPKAAGAPAGGAKGSQATGQHPEEKHEGKDDEGARRD